MSVARRSPRCRQFGRRGRTAAPGLHLGDQLGVARRGAVRRRAAAGATSPAAAGAAGSVAVSAIRLPSAASGANR